MSRRAVAAVLLLSGALVRAAHGQTPTQRLADGVRDYQNLDYESATAALRAALAASGPSALTDSERVRGLVYLGATDLYAGRRDSAVATFERLVILDPRYRIDQLVFPPEVSGLYQQVRLTTRAAALVAPPLTRIAGAGDRMVIWLYVASFHPVDVAVVAPNGATIRTLHGGGVGDSVAITWDGRSAEGAPLSTGQYVIRADSRGSDGHVVRSAGVGLQVVRTQRDTLPLPWPLPDSAFKPESAPGGSGLGPLVTGLAAAAAVVALPPLVASRGVGTGARYVVAGALGIAGFIGFPLQRRPRPLLENMAANQARRLAWQRQADSVRAENAARRQDVTLVIRASPWRPMAPP